MRRTRVGVGTGTDALAIALRALGIGPGDEVITSPLSAAYSALAIMMAGARPVFADIDPDRLTLDPRAAAAAVTPRTAAIMPVHLYGQPADMPAIVAVADRHNLAIVEDCCQAHLATCDGQPGRQLRRSGGVQLLPDEEPRRARRRRRADDERRGARGARHAAAQRRPDRPLPPRRVRRELAARRDAGGDPARPPAAPPRAGPRAAARSRRHYRAALAGVDTVVVPPELDAGHVYHLFPVRSDARDAMQAHLRAAGVETLIHYPVPIPQQPALATERPADCPVADRVCAEVFSLPLYPALPDAAIAEVASALASGPRRRQPSSGATTQPELVDRLTVDALRPPAPRSLRRSAAAQFGVFEVALRTWGSSEAAPAFQGLFDDDPAIGYRLKPNARVRFTTAEFDTEIAINGAGVRDDEEIGPKAPNERRIVLLGDSLVLSVQVPFAQTFGELLERRLNAEPSAVPLPGDQRRRAGLRAGRGAAFFRVDRRRRSSPTSCIETSSSATTPRRPSRSRLAARRRPAERAPLPSESLSRRGCGGSSGAAWCCRLLRLRVVAATDAVPRRAAPRPSRRSRAMRRSPAPRIARGPRDHPRCVAATSRAIARGRGRTTAIVLMPARFQVDDADYGRLKEVVAAAGGELVRDAATERFDAALAPLGLPLLDLLPALRARAARARTSSSRRPCTSRRAATRSWPTRSIDSSRSSGC